jgi:hypothetical protein
MISVQRTPLLAAIISGSDMANTMTANVMEFSNKIEARSYELIGAFSDRETIYATRILSTEAVKNFEERLVEMYSSGKTTAGASAFEFFLSCLVKHNETFVPRWDTFVCDQASKTAFRHWFHFLQ